MLHWRRIMKSSAITADKARYQLHAVVVDGVKVLAC